jgi:SAM-dependent methyltransferase
VVFGHLSVWPSHREPRFRRVVRLDKAGTLAVCGGLPPDPDRGGVDTLPEFMRREHLSLLCCPECRGSLELVDSAEHGARVETGNLRCLACSRNYSILRHIPRFVPSDNYSAGFGLQWNLHSRTQLDEHTGLALSEKRFFEESRWPRRLDDETIIEAGCGAGRFTSVAASTGATVLSLDYSEAVEANYASNGDRENVVIVQGDIYSMPFREADRIFCFGVIQHTPDPRAAFLTLPRHVKPGGIVAADVYLKSFQRYFLGPKYWLRPLTRRVRPEALQKWTHRYVNAMWPLAKVVRRLPRVGRILNWRFLIADYSDQISDDALLREWAHLDAFDMLSPRYDYPQTLKTVRRWGTDADLLDFEAERCEHGIVMRGQRPRGSLDS